jgi:mycoredoxin
MAGAATRRKAIMYTHPECGYCSLLKEEFKRDGVEYDEIDVSRQPEMWAEVQRLTGGDKITPVTLMPDGTVRIGFKGIGCAF